MSLTSSEITPVQQATPIVPTSQKERYIILDALRGFALLGVLIVNMLQAYSPVVSNTDEVVATLIRAFGEGTFYPMFSFLFGLGFALQLRKGEAALPRFRRRLFVLLGIGLVHGILIWVGDILFTYAVLGYVLIYFRNKSDRKLLVSALLLWLFVFALYLLSNVGTGGELFAPKMEPDDLLRPTGDTYFEAVRARLEIYPLTLLGLFYTGPSVLAFFITGYFVGRKGVPQVISNKPFLRSIAITSTVLAAPFILWFLGVLNVFDRAGWLYIFESIVASPLLGFAYLAGLTLYADPLKNVSKPFVPIGQMALSNYLGQSLICTTLFFPYAFNLYGKLGAAATLLISLAIFAFQIVFSAWWLSQFRFGPVEWVWRSLTYGEVQTLRRGD